MSLKNVIEQAIAHYSKPETNLGHDPITGFCRYKTKNGDMCAIGCLITPEINEKIEKVWSDALKQAGHSCDQPLEFLNLQMSIDTMVDGTQAYKTVVSELLKCLGMKSSLDLSSLQTLHDVCAKLPNDKDRFVETLKDILDGKEYSSFSPQWDKERFVAIKASLIHALKEEEKNG